jgi:hypothetical protein
MIGELTPVEKFYMSMLDSENKLDRDLFDKICANSTHFQSRKLPLYWAVLQARVKGKSLREAGKSVGLSGERIRQFERKLMSAKFWYDNKLKDLG